MGEQHQYGFFDGCGHRFARYLFACFSGIGATRVENRHQEENPNRRQRPHTFPGSAEAALPRPDRVPGKLVGRQTRGRRVPPQAGESSFGPELRNGNGSAPRNARGGRDPHNFGIRVCAGEAGCHTGASPAGRIGLFTTESCVRDEAARPNPKARRRVSFCLLVSGGAPHPGRSFAGCGGVERTCRSARNESERSGKFSPPQSERSCSGWIWFQPRAATGARLQPARRARN